MSSVAERQDTEQPGTPRPRRARIVRASLLSLLAVAVILSAVLVAWSGKRGLGADPVGSMAPGFTLPLLDGEGEVSLSDLRGKVVVLNFWASWCTACKAEAKVLEAGWQKWRSRGVVFLGVDTQDSRRWGMEKEKEWGTTYRSVFDGDSRTKNRYGTTGIPETFFIDARGEITGKQIGAIDAVTLDEMISGALTEREEASS